MKKLLTLMVSAALLTACASAPKLTNAGDTPSVGIPAKKASMTCTGCEDYSSVSSYFKPLREKADYQLTINYDVKYENGGALALTWFFITIFTIYTLPSMTGHDRWQVTAELYNAKTNEKATLSTLNASQTEWMAWWLIPWMKSGDVKKDYMPAMQKLAGERYVKEAAALVYQPRTSPFKWECVGYVCKFKEMLKQEYFSPEDVVWVAQNTHDFADFQTARKRLNGTLSTDDNCEIAQGLVLDKKTVSKQTQLYWNLIEFYKKSCHPTEKGLGMHRADLLDTRGVPSGMYQVNADTEVITFSDLVNGKTQKQHYTLDRGIVTEIK